MSLKDNPINQIRSFNRFYTNIIGVVDRHILASPFSLTEARVIYEINQSQIITARDIKNLLNVDEGYISRVIDKLTGLNIINKQKSENDRRITYLSLTDKGKNIFHTLNYSSEQAIRELISTLNEEDLNRLTNAMAEIIKIFKSRGVPNDET